MTLLIKVVTQMKFSKIATLLQKDLLFTLYNMGIYLAPAVTNEINGIYMLLLVSNEHSLILARTFYISSKIVPKSTCH